MTALRTLTDIVRWADELTRTAVAHARAGGASWTTVGAAVGTSRQAAYERFRNVAPVTPATTPADRDPAPSAPSAPRTPSAPRAPHAPRAPTAPETDEAAPADEAPAGQPAQPSPQRPREQPQFAEADTGVGLLALNGLVDLVAARQAGCPACGYWTWRPCDEHLPTALASMPAHPPRWADGDAVEVRPVSRKATVAAIAGWQAKGRSGKWVYRVDFPDDGLGRPGPGWWDESALRRARSTPSRRGTVLP